MNAAQLRAAADRARREHKPVHLLPGDAEALADELDRLVGVFDNERCDSAFWQARAALASTSLAAAHDAIRHAGASAITCSCDGCAAAVCAAMEG